MKILRALIRGISYAPFVLVYVGALIEWSFND